MNKNNGGTNDDKVGAGSWSAMDEVRDSCLVVAPAEEPFSEDLEALLDVVESEVHESRLTAPAEEPRSEDLEELLELLELLEFEDVDVHTDGSLGDSVLVTFVTYGNLESLRPLTLLIDTDARLCAEQSSGRLVRADLTFLRHVDGPASVWQLETLGHGKEAMEFVRSFLDLAEVFLRAARPDLFEEPSAIGDEIEEDCERLADEDELEDDGFADAEYEYVPLDVDAGERALFNLA